MDTVPRPSDALVHGVCLQLKTEDDEAFAAALRTAVAAAAGVYGEFTPSADALAQQLTSCFQEREPSTWSEHIGTLNAADIWLCAALAEGEPNAVRVFEQRLGPEIRLALGRFSLSDDQRAELGQQVRVRLLVPAENAPPRITLYRGWGSLEGWTRTITARLALNAIRDRGAVEPLERAPDLIGASPEFAALKTSRREMFMEALGRAFQSLEPRARALLRLRYLDGVQANALAGSYDVHESTMSRWLANARNELQARFETEARALLTDEVAVDELLGAMQSRFGQSLQQLFVSELADATEV